MGRHYAVSASVDGGRSWAEVASLRDADAMGWAFSRDRVYVSGHPGLHVSRDSGRTFQQANEGLPHTDVHALGGAVDVVYGAFPGAGVFASTSATGGWRVRTEGDGQPFFGRIGVDADNPEHVLAADAQQAVVESDDGGRTWRGLGSGMPATWLAASADLDVLVASGPAGAVRSDSGGGSWEGTTMRRTGAGAGTGARFVAACVAVVAAVACGADGADDDADVDGAAADASGYEVMADAVCDAARAARGGDRDRARVAFFDGAHQALHELAAETGEVDRPAAARLLESKQEVESALSGGDVEAAFSRLVPATEAALQAVDGPRLPCATDDGAAP